MQELSDDKDLVSTINLDISAFSGTFGMAIRRTLRAIIKEIDNFHGSNTRCNITRGKNGLMIINIVTDKEVSEKAILGIFKSSELIDKSLSEI